MKYMLMALSILLGGRKNSSKTEWQIAKKCSYDWFTHDTGVTFRSGRMQDSATCI